MVKPLENSALRRSAAPLKPLDVECDPARSGKFRAPTERGPVEAALLRASLLRPLTDSALRRSAAPLKQVLLNNLRPICKDSALRRSAAPLKRHFRFGT